MTTPITETHPDRETWLAARRRGIGASEAAAVIGKSPWRTPLEVYFEKTGAIADKPATAPMVWGRRWEQLIREAYAEETGYEVINAERMAWHPDVPFMFSTIDGERADRVVEIKKVNSRAAGDFGPSGSNQIPIYYGLQVQQQMACTGHGLADLAALIGETDFRIYTIERDDKVIGGLIDAEAAFWDCVVKRIPPLPDFQHPTTIDLLKMIDPTEGRGITLDDEAATLADEYERLGDTERLAKKAREEIQARLIHAMGKAAVAYLPDDRQLVRKAINRNGYTVKPCSYVSFTVKHPKGD